MSLHVSVFTCVSTAVHAHCPIKTPHARLARALSPVNNSLAWQQVALTAGINIQLGEVILKLCTDARIFRQSDALMFSCAHAYVCVFVCVLFLVQLSYRETHDDHKDGVPVGGAIT